MTENNQKRILVIDDDEDLCRLLQVKLNQEDNLQVEFAREGGLGITLAKKYHPHLIILDIMMPGINGIDVLKKLKSQQETMETPVIMLTAKNNESLKTAASYAYAEKYLTKPVDVEALIEEVQNIVNRF